MTRVRIVERRLTQGFAAGEAIVVPAGGTVEVVEVRGKLVLLRVRPHAPGAEQPATIPFRVAG